MTINIILLVLAMAIIAGLGVYAGKLLFLLRQQKQKHKAMKQQHLNDTLESIHLIAKAVSQGQCELSEGTIRLCVLLERFGVEDGAEQFPHLHDLYARIKHMPTHQARKALSKQERFKMDQARERYEQELEEKILNEVAILTNFH